MYQLTIAEPTEAVSVEEGPSGQMNTARPDGRRRRRVSQNEAREIGRLYAETSTPTSEIREQFGIGDSSLYRIVQRQGIALRGRVTSATGSKPPPAARARRAAARAGTARSAAGRHQFRILFLGERIVAATDVQDALRQARAFGAIEITAVSRAD